MIVTVPLIVGALRQFGCEPGAGICSPGRPDPGATGRRRNQWAMSQLRAISSIGTSVICGSLVKYAGYGLRCLFVGCGYDWWLIVLGALCARRAFLA
jgi:hypothetical protein